MTWPTPVGLVLASWRPNEEEFKEKETNMCSYTASS